jgi:sugar O-acyltransferase (sialic acid O-acetyltransferase NeuD family)
MSRNRVICIGADGLAKQSLSLLSQWCYANSEYWLFDDVNEDPNSYGYNLITSKEELEYLCTSGFFDSYVIFLGNPAHREYFDLWLSSFDLQPLTLIYDFPTTNIDGDYDSGCLILSQTLIEPYASIGRQVLMNVGSKVFHDVIVGDYCELMPGSTILGKAKIGNRCRIGSNSTILPGINICDDVIIGAGAVVNKDILEPGTYVGVPAKRIK